MSLLLSLFPWLSPMLIHFLQPCSAALPSFYLQVGSDLSYFNKNRTTILHLAVSHFFVPSNGLKVNLFNLSIRTSPQISTFSSFHEEREVTQGWVTLSNITRKSEIHFKYPCSFILVAYTPHRLKCEAHQKRRLERAWLQLWKAWMPNSSTLHGAEVISKAWSQR